MVMRIVKLYLIFIYYLIYILTNNQTTIYLLNYKIYNSHYHLPNILIQKYIVTNIKNHVNYNPQEIFTDV